MFAPKMIALVSLLVASASSADSKVGCSFQVFPKEFKGALNMSYAREANSGTTDSIQVFGSDLDVRLLKSGLRISAAEANGKVAYKLWAENGVDERNGEISYGGGTVLTLEDGRKLAIGCL